jgi:hypothetical protein
VEDDKVDAREVRRRTVHVPGLGVLDRLRAERHPLVHPDQVHAQFLGLLKDGEGHLRVVHPPRVGRAEVITHVVELERFRAELADLPLHQIQGLAAFQRVHRSPEDGPARIAAGQVGAFLPGRQAVLEQVGQRQRHGHQHVGVGFVVDHLADVRHRPLESELAGLGPGDPVTEAGQFRNKVCCAGVAVPGADPGSWWALGISARGLDLPASLLGKLQFAADLAAKPPRRQAGHLAADGTG